MSNSPGDSLESIWGHEEGACLNLSLVPSHGGPQTTPESLRHHVCHRNSVGCEDPRELQPVECIFSRLCPKRAVTSSQFQKCPRGGADETGRSSGPHFAFVKLWNKLASDEYNPLTVLSSKEEFQKNRAYLWIQTQEAVLF